MTNVFHVDRLRKYQNNPLPGQANEIPPGETINDKEEFEVEKVIASRIFRGKLQYQVSWKGRDPDETWYDAESFKNAVSRLEEYHQAHPNEAGPPVRLDEWKSAATDDYHDPPHPDDNKPVATDRPLRRSRRRQHR